MTLPFEKTEKFEIMLALVGSIVEGINCKGKAKP